MAGPFEFIGFPKIGRLSKPVIITEKIDGTNAQILILEINNSAILSSFWYASAPKKEIAGVPYLLMVGSRSRWLTPDNDNFGFCRWAYDNVDDLFTLGHGRHFGEWWGKGIQRGYGMTEKKFSLFNTSRWIHPDNQDLYRNAFPLSFIQRMEKPPECCSVVPTVAILPKFNSVQIDNAMASLKEFGSLAKLGFKNPEGIVAYHTGGNVCFKKTFEQDEGKFSEPS